MQVALRAGLASRAIRAPVRPGFDRLCSRDGHGLFINRRIPSLTPGHVTDGFPGFCEAMGIRDRTLRWEIPVPESVHGAVVHLVFSHETAVPGPGPTSDSGPPLLVIGPCSSDRFPDFRNWPAEHYARVAWHAASHHGLQVVLTDGKRELERCYRVSIERELKKYSDMAVPNLDEVTPNRRPFDDSFDETSMRFPGGIACVILGRWKASRRQW